MASISCERNQLERKTSGVLWPTSTTSTASTRESTGTLEATKAATAHLATHHVEQHLGADTTAHAAAHAAAAEAATTEHVSRVHEIFAAVVACAFPVEED